MPIELVTTELAAHQTMANTHDKPALCWLVKLIASQGRLALVVAVGAISCGRSHNQWTTNTTRTGLISLVLVVTFGDASKLSLEKPSLIICNVTN